MSQSSDDTSFLRKANPAEKAAQASAAKVAVIAALASFGWMFYKYQDVLRALVIAGVVFIMLFWVVLRGKNLEHQQKNRDSQWKT